MTIRYGDRIIFLVAYVDGSLKKVFTSEDKMARFAEFYEIQEGNISLEGRVCAGLSNKVWCLHRSALV